MNINTVLQGNRLNSASTFLSILVLTLVLSFFHSNELVAAERISYSIDTNKKTNSTIELKTVLDTNIQKAPALIIKGEQQAIDSIDTSNRIYIGNPLTANTLSLNSIAPVFSIYDASVQLIHDYDFDGYYHHFSVTFDADIDAGSAIVYARMYISYEGGPWNYYYTTRTFEIIGNNDFDSHTVETIFSTGYKPGFYEIRIDLFEDGWDGRVVAYGPYEDYDLKYIPLEDEEHEFNYESYQETNYSSHDAGCSLNPNSVFDPVFPIMILLSFIYMFRKYYSRIKNQET